MMDFREELEQLAGALKSATSFGESFRIYVEAPTGSGDAFLNMVSQASVFEEWWICHSIAGSRYKAKLASLPDEVTYHLKYQPIEGRIQAVAMENMMATATTFRDWHRVCEAGAGFRGVVKEKMMALAQGSNWADILKVARFQSEEWWIAHQAWLRYDDHS